MRNLLHPRNNRPVNRFITVQSYKLSRLLPQVSEYQRNIHEVCLQTGFETRFLVQCGAVYPLPHKISAVITPQAAHVSANGPSLHNNRAG